MGWGHGSCGRHASGNSLGNGVGWCRGEVLTSISHGFRLLSMMTSNLGTQQQYESSTSIHLHVHVHVPCVASTVCTRTCNYMFLLSCNLNKLMCNRSLHKSMYSCRVRHLSNSYMLISAPNIYTHVHTPTCMYMYECTSMSQVWVSPEAAHFTMRKIVSSAIVALPYLVWCLPVSTLCSTICTVYM